MFDASGNLPQGIHRLTIEDVLQRFGTGRPRREWLGARLRELLLVAQSCGLVRRVYLWGSFSSAKPDPNDLDILLVFQAGLTDDQLVGPVQDLVDHERARLRFTADVFWVREDIGQAALQLLLETYGFDRQNRPRGIVEVLL